MINHKLYILTLPERSDRREVLIPQLEREGIDYEFVYGVRDNVTFRAVCQGHKKIVQAAKDRGDDYVIVAEDDIEFGNGSWKYFIDSIPADFDLFFGGVSNGFNDESGYCRDYRGNWLYVCNSQFYDALLSVGEMAHIDVSLSELKNTKFIIIDRFVAKHLDGVSDQNHGYKTYGHLWENRVFYNQNK